MERTADEKSSDVVVGEKRKFELINPSDDPFSSWELINQGAEARIWRISQGKSAPASLPAPLLKTLEAKKSLIAKERFKKKYRLEVLDKKITKGRVSAETKCIAKCVKNGIDVPDVYHIDKERAIIYMEDLLPEGGAR